MRRLTPLLALLLLSTFALGAADDAADKGWLGVYLDNDEIPDGSGEALRPAVVIRGVVEDGPAADAGLRARDVIVAVDGAPVGTLDELIARIGQTSPGSWVPLTVRRGRSERDIRVHLGKRPSRTDGLRVRRGWIGVESIDLPPALRVHFGTPESAGVMISAVEETSPAAAAGLDLGDVVYQVEGTEVVSSEHLAQLLRGAGVGNEIEITLMRAGTEITVEPLVDEEPVEAPRER